MPIGTGINHIATLTADADATVRFYQEVFDAEVEFEMAQTGDHPRMIILDLGGTALNIFEVPLESIIGDRRRQGGRGAIDHFGIGVASRKVIAEVQERLVRAGAQEVGEIQQLGGTWSLFFRDRDGMELEVCATTD